MSHLGLVFGLGIGLGLGLESEVGLELELILGLGDGVRDKRYCNSVEYDWRNCSWRYQSSVPVVLFY